MSRNIIFGALTSEIVTLGRSIGASSPLTALAAKNPESTLRNVALLLGLAAEASCDEVIDAIDTRIRPELEGDETGDEGGGDPSEPNAEPPPPAELARLNADTVRWMRDRALNAPTATARRDAAILAQALARKPSANPNPAAADPVAEAEELRATSLHGPKAWAAARAKQRDRQKAQRKRTDRMFK